MSMRTARAVGMKALAALLAATAIVWLGASAPDGYRASRSDLFWDRLWFEGASGPHYDSVEELESASDVVILGRITTVEEGRVFGDPHPDNPNPKEELVAYVTAIVEVDSVLAGALEDSNAKSIRLELPMPRQDALSDLVGNGPDEPAVFFVFNAGRSAAMQGRSAEVQEREREYYALVGFGAVVRNLDGKASPVDAPEMDFLKAFESESFDRFVERIEPAP